MLLGEKVISRETFWQAKLKGRKHNIQVPSVPLPEFEEFSSR
jgi:hypothetical protein